MIAIVIGATGATGIQLIKQLLEDKNYKKVKIFVRKNLTIENSKLENNIVDFDNLESWKEKLTGDVLFSTLGTTLKQAGSKQNQYKVDFTYQYEVAKFSAENNVKKYVLVSSMGANSKSKIFYSRMKGELENAVKKLNFDEIHIFQPGMLDRQIKDGRKLEHFSLKTLQTLNKIGILKSQKPLLVSKLAESMRKVVQKSTNKKINIYTWNNLISEN